MEYIRYRLCSSELFQYLELIVSFGVINALPSILTYQIIEIPQQLFQSLNDNLREKINLIYVPRES